MAPRFVYRKGSCEAISFLTIPLTCIFVLLSCAALLAQPLEDVLAPRSDNPFSGNQQSVFDIDKHTLLKDSGISNPSDQKPLTGSPGGVSGSLRNLLDALDVMQTGYFELWLGTWPTSIDWTAAVLGSHVSATLSTLSLSLDNVIPPGQITTAGSHSFQEHEAVHALAFENLINYYFEQTSSFYFGENAFAL